MKQTIALLVLILAGCVSTSDIVPVGKDSYMLTVNARGPGAGKGRIESMKSANKYCTAMNQHMIIRRSDTSGIAIGALPETTALVFSCVGEDDPEWQRPNLRKDPTTVIEDARR